MLIEPTIINNFLSDFDYKNALNAYSNLTKLDYDDARKRYTSNDSLSQMILIGNTEKARSVFGSSSLLPTYAVYAKYVGPGAILEKHIDENACTFTLDLCLKQTHPWGLWVDDKEYILKENEALAYYGNDQKHWRNEMDWAGTVEMIFLHYAEPDHWWFKQKKYFIGQ